MLQSCQDRQEEARQEQVLSILREVLFFFLLFILVDLVRLTQNQKESELRMKNLECPLSVGAGMAHAYFSYLQTVVNGREDYPGHSEALEAYLESECIDDPEALWVSKKVYVFFATDPNIQLGIQDVRKMEKRQNNENIQREMKRGRVPMMRQDSFYLVLEQLTSTYTASGQARPTNVFFLKMENNQTKGMNYAVFVENRPLKSLEYMVQDPQIQFDERDFKLQASLYYKELSKLVSSSNLRSRVQLIMVNSPGEKVFYHTVWRTIQEEKKTASQRISRSA